MKWRFQYIIVLISIIMMIITINDNNDNDNNNNIIFPVYIYIFFFSPGTFCNGYDWQEQLPRIPRSHLREVAKVPKQLEQLGDR